MTAAPRHESMKALLHSKTDDGVHGVGGLLSSSKRHSFSLRDAQLAMHQLVDSKDSNPMVGPLLSCLFYSVASISMVIVNKLILTSYSFNFPMVLMFHQNLSSVMLLLVAKSMGWVDFEGLSYQKVKAWLPLNVFFVAMLLSGFYSINLLSVPMVTIFKNSNNMLITFGDWFFFGQVVSKGTIATMGIMVAAAVMAGLNDLSFNMLGYIWMAFNCLSTVAYVLYMKKAATATKLSSFGKVYYNNLLSLPLILLGDALVFQDFPRLYASDLTEFGQDTSFLFLFAIAGVIGFMLSMSSFACVQRTSPTTYAMVGSLNKIPLSILGLWIFNSTISMKGGLLISVSLFAGVLYAYTKAMEFRDASKARELADAKV